jgi:hypothetical protein
MHRVAVGTLLAIGVATAEPATGANVATANISPAPAGIPVLSTAVDIASKGYAEKEFFLSGTANSFSATNTLLKSGFWKATASSTRQPYTTRVLGLDASQAAMMLATYANAVQPLAQAIDGLLIQGRPYTATDLSGNLNVLMNYSQIRTDLTIPVLLLQGEFDLVTGQGVLFRQGDTSSVRTWEVAGASHESITTLLGFVQRDGHGNARGGVRLPEIIVPRLTYSINNLASNPLNVSDGTFCLLAGSATSLSSNTLTRLYPSNSVYKSAYQQAATAAVAAGVMLQDDADLAVSQLP